MGICLLYKSLSQVISDLWPDFTPKAGLMFVEDHYLTSHSKYNIFGLLASDLFNCSAFSEV